MNYSLSSIDYQRFGVVTAKCTLEATDSIQDLLKASQADAVELLIVRIPTYLINKVQELENAGGFLTDTLVYFLKKEVENLENNLPLGYTTRLATPADSKKLENLALKTFNGYMGHYHADKKLKKENCDLVYSSWAAASCADKKVADAVILIEKSDVIAAFATIKVCDKNMIDGVLFGVSPNHTKLGLHKALMILSQRWAINNHIKKMITSTQVTNINVQKNWVRLGFELDSSYYTFHKWFNYK
jgi:hypothetical protein